MKTKIFKITALVLVFIIVFPAASLAEGGDSTLENTLIWLKEGFNPVFGDEWAVLALARGGADGCREIFSNYLGNLAQYLAANEGILHKTKYTENARVALALLALGQNPQNFEGYDVLSPLKDFEKVIKQGVSGAAYAAIAIDSAMNVCELDQSFSVAKDKYLAFTAEVQREDYGFSLGNTSSDPDVTAIAIQALTLDEKYQIEVNNAIDFLSKTRLENGRYRSLNGETSESLSQVILSLISAGIDPSNHVDSLKEYYVSGGGFKHFDGGKADTLASTQGALALIAVDRYNKKLPDVFQMTDADTVEPAGTPAIHSDVKLPAFIDSPPVFSDIGDKNEAVIALAQRGIIKGFPDGTFKPENPLTRGEFTAIVIRSLGLESEAQHAFGDIPNWCKNEVAAAHAYEIINGKSPMVFDPDGLVTLQEAALITARTAKLLGKTSDYSDDFIRDSLSIYTDYTKVSSWAKGGMTFCLEQKIIEINGMEIAPKRAVSRQECAQMIFNLLHFAGLL